MFSPPPTRTRLILALATAPFVVGALMGCTHSLLAALLLLTLQLPYTTRVQTTKTV